MKKQFTYSLILSIIVLFVPLIFLSSCQNEIPEDTFRFIFMTDIHVQPELSGDEGFKQAIQKVNKLKPDFVITGGDLVFDALGRKIPKTSFRLLPCEALELAEQKQSVELEDLKILQDS